jgi:aryl-alcohol dehydrogenase-like predicted oxidoreductase
MTETSNTKLSLAYLGKNGPLVPRIGLGCMGFSAFYSNQPPDEEALKVRSLALCLALLLCLDMFS